MAAFDPSRTTVHKGRGATYDPHNRFAPTRSVAEDDGWWQEEATTSLATEVREEASKSALSWNNSPDLPFDRSLNPYRGCEHGCIYCFARPSHAYLGLSPGLDFESKLTAKPGAAALLRKELMATSYECSPISLGANTDPYQPIERQYQITREILTVLESFKHPCTIVTKSALVERDVDILSRIPGETFVKSLYF